MLPVTQLLSGEAPSGLLGQQLATEDNAMALRAVRLWVNKLQPPALCEVTDQLQHCVQVLGTGREQQQVVGVVNDRNVVTVQVRTEGAVIQRRHERPQ